MEKTIKILITTIGKFPHIGGKSVHMETLHKLLSKQYSFEPKIVSFADLSFLKQTICALPRLTHNLSLDFALRRIFLQKRLKKLNVEEIPLMLIQDSPAYLLAQRFNKPYILTVHGSAADEYASKKDIKAGERIYHKLLEEEIQAARNAFAVITVDTNLKNQIIARSHIDSSRVTMLPNTVDSTTFSPPTNKKVFKTANGFSDSDFVTVLTRRLVPKNGVRYAIEALALLKRPEVKLVIAGDGPERNSLEQLVTELDLQNQVVFCGAQPHENTPALLKGADLALLPSVPENNVVEATSISALEAMAVSLPIIASEIGGLKELLSGGSGILIPPKNPEAIMCAWQYIIDNPKEAKLLGKKAREIVLTEYSTQRWIKTYGDLILSALKTAPSRLGVRQ